MVRGFQRKQCIINSIRNYSYVCSRNFFEKSIFQQYIPNTDVIQKMFEEVKAGA